MSKSLALAPGASFGPYDIVAELGRGGMGAVYRARERASGREIALKVMLDKTGATDADRERFRREGQVAASLDHPGIVRIHAAGDHGGLMFLACELVEGARDLARAARELPPLERARLVRDAARALGHAHARGIVHRDVKPDNLLVDAAGRVRVADFGVAAAQSLERLTQSGAIVGTPRYMAPEQIDSDRKRIGPHSDVWALGVVLHEVLAGVRPFEASTIPSLYNLILNHRAPDLRVAAPDAPPALADICARALAKRPEDRYPHGAALAAELDRVLAGQDTLAGAARRARRRRGGLAVAALVLCVTAVAGWVLRARPDAPPPAEPTSTSAVTETAALEVDPGAHGWVLLAAKDEGLEVRGRLAGAQLVVRIDGVAVPSEQRLPLRVPVPSGAWAHVVVELTSGGAVPDGGARVEARVLRLPDHLERSGPSAARTRDGSELLLVPPPRSGTFARRQLRAGNGSGVRYDVLSDEEYDKAEPVVALAYPFLLGRTEVSRGAYQGAAIDSPDLPMVTVSHADAEAYAATRGLVLPTISEWMWAAGGGDEARDFPWGKATGGKPANFAAPGTCPVDSMPEGAGRWGQLHLAGNVYEWVAAGERSDTDPSGLLAKRTAMGGSWQKAWPAAATDLRCRVDARVQDPDIGFRLAWRPAAKAR